MLKIPCFSIFLPVLIFSFNIALSAMHTNCTHDYNRRVSQESFFLVKILTRYILRIFISNALNEFSIFIHVHDTMKFDLNHESIIDNDIIYKIDQRMSRYVYFIFRHSSFDCWIFALNLSVRENRFFFFFSYISKMDVSIQFLYLIKSFNNFFAEKNINCFNRNYITYKFLENFKSFKVFLRWLKETMHSYLFIDQKHFIYNNELPWY